MVALGTIRAVAAPSDRHRDDFYLQARAAWPWDVAEADR